MDFDAESSSTEAAYTAVGDVAVVDSSDDSSSGERPAVMNGHDAALESGGADKVEVSKCFMRLLLALKKWRLKVEFAEVR